MATQMNFEFPEELEPAPQWIEDILTEMERQDFLNAIHEVLIIELIPDPDPLPVVLLNALRRLSVKN